MTNTRSKRSLVNSQMGRHKRGTVLVWVALSLLTLLGFVGLCLDFGMVYIASHQLQNGADAAALAGALVVKENLTRARQDAVALAATNNVLNSPSITVLSNDDNDPNGDVVIGRWISITREFLPTTLSPNAVKVTTRRLAALEAPRDAIPLVFGPIFNKDTADVSRVAIARSTGDTGAGILTIAADPTIYPDWPPQHGESGFVTMGSSGTIDLRGIDMETGDPLLGDLHINATSTDSQHEALHINAGIDVYASNLNVVGSTDPAIDQIAQWEAMYAGEPFSVNTGVSSLEDPLYSLNTNSEYPNTDIPGSLTDVHGVNTIDDDYVSTHGVYDDVAGVYTLTLDPGYYPGGIKINNSNSKIVLRGGVSSPTSPSKTESEFAFGGGDGSGPSQQRPGLVVTGGTLMNDPPGVLIYITGNPDEGVPYGQIDIGGNAVIDLTSRGDSVYDSDAPIGSALRDFSLLTGELGVVLWQDENNPSMASIIGTGDLILQGTLYLAYNPVTAGGDSESFGSQIIAGALALNGGIDVNVGYDGRNRLESNEVKLVY